MNTKMATWVAWTVCATTAIPLWAQPPQTEAGRRTQIHQSATERAVALDVAERKANEEYDRKITELQTALTAQREAHAARRIEHRLALRKIDEGYTATLATLATSKAGIQTGHERTIAALDRELAAIQKRAAEAYTEAVRAELLAHDGKRTAAEADRKKRLEAAETARLRAIDTYLADITATQEAQQKELKELDDARAKLLASQDTERAAARETLQKELDRIRAARREAQVATATELYEAVGVPGRTVPPVGAERHDLIDLSWERADASGAARIDVLVDGKAIADDDAGKKLKEALARAIVPGPGLKAEDGFDDALRTLAFGPAGTLTLGGKAFEVKFSFAVGETANPLAMPMAPSVQRTLLTRVERAVVAAHDRAPWEEFTVGNRRALYYLLDESGAIRRPQVPTQVAAVREILTARERKAIAGLSVDAKGPQLDGKPLRLQWQFSNDGQYVAADAETQQLLDRRLAAQIARLTGTGTVPTAVRTRLTAGADAGLENANLQRPLALHADAACDAYRFYRQGRELVVLDTKSKEVLFRVEGLYQLTRLACGPNGGLAFAATRITYAKPIDRNWTKTLGNNLKAADVTDDDRQVSVKDGEALFIYAGGKLTLALSPTLGRFGAVRTTTDGYRVWFWDRDERALVGEFTLRVAVDGSKAEPDVAAQPTAAQVALQAPAVVVPPPRPKTGSPR